MIVLLFFASLLWSEEVTIIKQWHLSPGQQTLDTEASKKLPQFTNQRAIYDKILKMAESGKVITVISEGCEGDVNKANHYGWDLEKLENKKASSEFADILAFTPVKLKVKLGSKVKIVCSDSDELMKKNSLAFSNLRAFSGYYSRLKQFKDKDKKNYSAYEESLFSKQKDKIGKVDAINYAREKALESIGEIKKYIDERNQKIIENAKALLGEDPVVIVGGLHAKGLVEEMKKKNIKFNVFVPDGYREEDEGLLQSLESQFK